MNKRNNMNKGFTLIELITVVIIIAIMAALALPQYTRFVERSQASTAKSALGMIRKAEGTYFALYSQYTNASGNMSALAAEMQELGRLNNSTEWTYSATSDDGSTYTATATRKKGIYNTGIITITDSGEVLVSGGSPKNATADKIWD